MDRTVTAPETTTPKVGEGEAKCDLELLEYRAEILASRDLEIPEFHALQLPVAANLRAAAALIRRQAEVNGIRRLGSAPKP
jgi:hypothetical protein